MVFWWTKEHGPACRLPGHPILWPLGHNGPKPVDNWLEKITGRDLKGQKMFCPMRHVLIQEFCIWCCQIVWMCFLRQQRGVVMYPYYGRRRRKKIHAAASRCCLWPPLQIWKASTRWHAGAAEEELLLYCFELLTAPQCLAGSAHTHSVTCCQSATAADLVSMGEMSFAKVMILKDKTHSCIAWQTSHRFSRVETKDSLGKKELPRHLSGLQWNAQWCQTENGRTVDETNKKEIIATSYIFISNIASPSTWSKHKLA